MNLRILFATLLLSSQALLNAQEKLPTNDTSTSPPPAWEQIRRVPLSGGRRAFWNGAGGYNATN